MRHNWTRIIKRQRYESPCGRFILLKGRTVTDFKLVRIWKCYDCKVSPFDRNNGWEAGRTLKIAIPRVEQFIKDLLDLDLDLDLEPTNDEQRLAIVRATLVINPYSGK